MIAVYTITRRPVRPVPGLLADGDGVETWNERYQCRRVVPTGR
jgi:hypothetical protein